LPDPCRKSCVTLVSVVTSAAVLSVGRTSVRCMESEEFTGGAAAMAVLDGLAAGFDTLARLPLDALSPADL
jgi:hypothetical protein